MTIWDTEQSRIFIKAQEQPPGCSVAAFFIFGGIFLAAGIAIYMKFLDMDFIDNSLPVAVFSALFGIFGWFGAMGPRRKSVESMITVDSFNDKVSYHTSGGGADIVIPFAHLSAVVIHETVTKKSDTDPIHAERSISSQPKYRYTYRIYLLKNDGSIIWLSSFSRKPEALEHTRLLLERIRISCIDEAHGGLERTLENPYKDVSSRNVPTDVSSHVKIEDMEGVAKIKLRYERYGFRGVINFIFAFTLFIGCPVWFYIENKAMVHAWFLIIPSIPFVAMIILIFVRGRSYTAICRPKSIDVSIRFWFPLFQWFLGKTVEIQSSALKAVRVNRYEGDQFHLELIVDKNYSLPRGSKLAFNTGAVRMLPRAVLPEDLKPLGIWMIIPISQQGSGPLVSDLQSIEMLIQKIYRLDASQA